MAFRVTGARMISTRAVFAAGVSVLALGIACPHQVLAQTTEGVRQEDSGTIAINLYEVSEQDPPQDFGTAVSESIAGGAAAAIAEVLCAEAATCASPGAIEQSAVGTESARNTIRIGGLQTIRAEADASGQSASAIAFIDQPISQLAVGPDRAENEFLSSGTLDLHASANALAAETATAVAVLGGGVSQIATAGFDHGTASNGFQNDGLISISADAFADSDSALAFAGAAVGTAIVQQSRGVDAAANALTNSGGLDVSASAVAAAGTAGSAVASAVGVLQTASARTQTIVNSTTEDGAVVGVSTDAPTGNASAELVNSGSFGIIAAADVSGGGSASATAAASGVFQLASGAEAEVTIANSGEITVAADAAAEGAGNARAVTFVAGATQVATAIGYETREIIDPSGTLTVRLTSTPAGPSAVSLENSGSVDINGEVEVAAVAGTGTATEALGAAFVGGLNQIAAGAAASAALGNSGSIDITADASGSSSGVSNIVAIASGIDQVATAFANVTTLVFATSTEFPSTITGSVEAVGPASAVLANSGSLVVSANVLSRGEEMAFAGGTAAGVGQFAAGTSAAVSLENSGDIAVVADIVGEGDLGFAGAAAIGLTQAAQGTGLADIDLGNSATIAVIAEASGNGAAGGFANATAFGVVQQAQATDEANVALTNSGLLQTIAAAQGTGVTSAAAFAAVQGLGQLVVAGDGALSFTNDGEFEALAQVEASADELATAAATIRGGIIQQASGTGTATASIDNSGSIEIGSLALAEGGATAAATALVLAGIAQDLFTDAGGAASISNSGTIDILASAEALAGGGEVSDVAVAAAFALGVSASVIALGTEGSALVELSNEGSISIGADAHATGSGVAFASAAAFFGLGARAELAGNGDAGVSIVNDGDLTLAVAADATGGHTAVAVGNAAGGAVAFANVLGAGDAAAELANSGSITVRGDALAEATTNALAVAIGVTGVYMSARASNGGALAEITNSGTIDVVANATAAALVAQATAVGGGSFFGGAIFQSAAAVNADGTALIDNSGDVNIIADALADGSVAAFAAAIGGPGVNQFAFATSGDAMAGLTNSGSVLLSANGEANATNSAFATGFYFNAFVNSANAGPGGGDAAVGMTNSGEVTLVATADAEGPNVASALAWASNALGQLAFALEGDAAADLTNSGSIVIGADALAEGAHAAATATVVRGVFQTAVAVGGGTADALLTNEGTISIDASAVADSGTAAETGFGSAIAWAEGFNQSARAEEFATEVFTTADGAEVVSRSFGGSGPATAAIVNSGTYDVEASALANAVQTAAASAQIFGGTQDAIGTSVEVSLANSGELNLSAFASAVGDTIAFANSYNNGLRQSADATEVVQQEILLPDGGMGFLSGQTPLGPAGASLTNEGSIDIVSFARAEALGGQEAGTTFAPGTIANASAYASGLGQFVWGTNASGSVDNSGSFSVAAVVEVVGEDQAGGRAFAQGIRQGANTLGSTVADYHTVDGGYDHGENNLSFAGPASISTVNSGLTEVSADVSVEASEGPTFAAADARGLSHGASGTSAQIDIDNSGDLLIAANAQASGTTGLASAVAAGMTQSFSTALDLGIDITNSGAIDVQASAGAVQENGATAIAAAIGLTERGTAHEQAALAFDNSGTLSVDASAVAEGGFFAGGTAFATGVSQSTIAPQAELGFDNSGSIDIAASMRAVADAGTGFAGATAFAHGYQAFASELVADIANSGSIEAVARATGEGASGWAWATAAGIAVGAIGGTTFAPVYGEIGGTIANSGDIKVLASADGIADGEDSRASTAEAVGIALAGGRLTGSISNSGTIDVTAIVQSADGTASATGIRAEAAEGVVAFGRLNVANSGDLIVRVSLDGGTTFARGMAIDVASAPNGSIVNLLGGGNIYGNIDVRSIDVPPVVVPVIIVSGGETSFDGIVNPECMPPELDGESSSCGEGRLIIAADGTLFLRDQRITGDPDLYDGPSYVFVDELDVAAGGAIAFELQPAGGGTQAVGTYSQIFADEANLDGTLEARIATANGLFADSYVWNNVIDANVRNGTSDSCVLQGFEASVLLEFGCSYDTAGNVDLALTRIAFDAVDGLTRNQSSVAGGLEAAFDVDLTGPFSVVLANLFAFDREAFGEALNRLSGAAYANYLQSFASAGVHYNDLLDRATDCPVPVLRGTAIECRVNDVNLWGQVDYSERTQDGDVEAGDWDAKRSSWMIGADATLGTQTILGGSIARVSNHVDADDFGTTADADGWQLGLYGVYDPATFFVKAVGTYSWFDGDSERLVDLESLGGTVAGNLRGDPDARLWTLGLHSGYRVQTGASAVLTPYVNLDYAKAKLKGFTEEGTTGAELAVSGQSEDRAAVTVGAKWAALVGRVVPEVNLGYRHQFGDRRGSFDAAFAAVDSDAFTIVSTEEERGAFLAGLSVSGKLGPLDLRAGYEGQFNGDQTTHNANLRLVLPLGGRSAN